jgi:hypothetical protein
MTAGPQWVDRLERRCPAPRFYVCVAVLTALDGAMLSGVVGRWLVLPGLAGALGLLWLIAVHTGQRVALVLVFLLATAGLFLSGLFLIQDGPCNGAASGSTLCRDVQGADEGRLDL